MDGGGGTCGQKKIEGAVSSQNEENEHYYSYFNYLVLLNHQFIQKLKFVVEGKFNCVSPTLSLTCGFEIFERHNK